MRLHLVRHARPVVAAGLCYGSTDLPVDENHQQLVLARLESELPKRAKIYTSPLRRCHSLATALADRLDAGSVVCDTRLVEMDFGSWEMQAWNAIPRAEIDAWVADLANYRPGGGECLLDAARRVRAFHDDLRTKNPAEALVVAHAGTIRLLLASVQAMTVEEMVTVASRTPNTIAYGEMTTVDC